MTRAPRIKSMLDMTRHSWARSVLTATIFVYRPKTPIKKSMIAMTSVADFGAWGFIVRRKRNPVIKVWDSICFILRTESTQDFHKVQNMNLQKPDLG